MNPIAVMTLPESFTTPAKTEVSTPERM